MINLLPPQEKRNLLRETNWKLILILGFLALLFLVSLSLILFSMKIYISGQVESQKIFVDLEEKEFRESLAQNIEEEIKLINLNLSRLNSFYETRPDWTGLLEKISRVVPAGIYLTTLSLSSPTTEEGKFQIHLAGFCPTRPTLSEFKKRLESEPSFKEIYFPPEDWVKPKDIDFHLTFELEV